jgi:hypothetical protein
MSKNYRYMLAEKVSVSRNGPNTAVLQQSPRVVIPPEMPKYLPESMKVMLADEKWHCNKSVQKLVLIRIFLTAFKTLDRATSTILALTDL